MFAVEAGRQPRLGPLTPKREVPKRVVRRGEANETKSGNLSNNRKHVSQLDQAD